jgi:hypothetical protein
MLGNKRPRQQNQQHGRESQQGNGNLKRKNRNEILNKSNKNHSG